MHLLNFKHLTPHSLPEPFIMFNENHSGFVINHCLFELTSKLDVHVIKGFIQNEQMVLSGQCPRDVDLLLFTATEGFYWAIIQFIG